MPFTFSHPAIILPLHYFPKKWFSLTGLIIGSLTPDFEYFIRMKVKSIYSHTLLGVFWFDLPLAILLAFIFHNIIRNGLFSNLPEILQSRIKIFTEFDWNFYFKKNWFIVLLSTLLGIISHLFWDAFTHNHGYFVCQISALKNTISLYGNEIPFWKAAQHLSTFLGGILIIVAILKLPKSTISTSTISKKYWTVVFITTALVTTIRFSPSFDIKAIGNIIVSMISAFMIALILSPLIIKQKVK
ncbi:DUF4184 family protein [Flavobacterium branchiicola]|uniref:DUF4184 family protein n=1 Tax=Flavobacterium branchiicola TaxID=1114875 RepID=A0ABV9PJ62_9FLAO|nr:DUF4184 family protein [Flavobacterium branchiicola]MBS7255562.1 DUF4184 family protein [Flavobacterium branchiicola]